MRSRSGPDVVRLRGRERIGNGAGALGKRERANLEYKAGKQPWAFAGLSRGDLRRLHATLEKILWGS